MNGNVTYNGSQLLSGAINVNTTGNIQALNVQVTENGERTITPPEGVDGYAPITIDTNVPTPEPVLDTLNVTSNGTYTPPSGVDGYDEVNVSVPTQEPVLDTLNVNSNGTYTPPSGVDGYDEVNVSVSGYTIKTLSTTPTSIASFTDGTANPLKSLTASIVPVQAGSGDPSPTNVRPISGWTEEVINVRGVNQWDEVTESGIYNISTGQPQGEGSSIRGKNPISVKPNTTYYANNQYLRILFYDENDNYLNLYKIGSGEFTTPNNCYIIRIYLADVYGTTYNNDISINYPSTDTEYHAYSGTTTTIPFTDGQGQSVEVFGGSVDVINGVVTPCPYYASYNGEQLTGEWMSDRDVYSPNTTPTIGAQVVNIGATGTPFHTQPTSIKSLDGENNVSASTGDVEELKYFANL